jgi:hypothetical protein
VEAALDVRIGAELGASDFERDDALEVTLHRGIHDAHSADTEYVPEEVVVRDELAAPSGVAFEVSFACHEVYADRGSSKKKHEPVPYRLSTPMCPPCASMMRLLT